MGGVSAIFREITVLLTVHIQTKGISKTVLIRKSAKIPDNTDIRADKESTKETEERGVFQNRRGDKAVKGDCTEEERRKRREVQKIHTGFGHRMLTCALDNWRKWTGPVLVCFLLP